MVLRWDLGRGQWRLHSLLVICNVYNTFSYWVALKLWRTKIHKSQYFLHVASVFPLIFHHIFASVQPKPLKMSCDVLFVRNFCEKSQLFAQTTNVQWSFGLKRIFLFVLPRHLQGGNPNAFSRNIAERRYHTNRLPSPSFAIIAAI